MLLERPWGRTPVQFSQSAKQPARYAALEHVRGTSRTARQLLGLPEPVSDGGGAKPEAYLDLLFGLTSDAYKVDPFRVPVAKVPPEKPFSEGPIGTIAFAANKDAVALKFDTPDLYIYNLPSTPLTTEGDNYLYIDPYRIKIEMSKNDAQLHESAGPFFAPPLAAVQIGNHWRFAWQGRNGIWLAESDERNPGVARPIGDGPLLHGMTTGFKLQFTSNGDYLILNRGLMGSGSPTLVRVWDLRPAWREWINKADQLSALREKACSLVGADHSRGGIDDTEIRIFKIGDADKSCVKQSQAVQ